MKKSQYSLPAFVVILLFFLQTSGWTQNQSTEDYLYPINIQDSTYSGAGIDWLLSKAETKQFFLFGEQHGVKQLGPFIGFIYDTLANEGFTHLGLEMDPWTTQHLQDWGVERFISKYPNSIAFGYDGELHLIEKVIEAQKQHKVDVLGVDQMITAIHPLQRLVALSESFNSSRLARGAFLKASLKMGEYLREEHFEDFNALEAAFSKQNSAEIQQIIEELKTSMHIYTTWRAGQRGEVSKKKSPEVRENMMKEKFDAWMASGNGEQTQKKAIFKMGGAHLMYGIGPNGILTLGDHIRQRAESNGMETLSLGIRNFNPESAIITLEDFKNSDILVVDNKTLREQLTTNENAVPHIEKKQLSIDGFDAIIYFKDAEWSNQSIISKHKQQFRAVLINQLLPIGILLVLCLISLFPYTFQLFKLKQNKGPIAFSLISALALSVLAIYQLLAIRNIISHTATIMPASASLWIFIALFILSVFYLLLAFKYFSSKTYGTVFRIYFLLMALCFAVLSGYCYYWNIGGMLGLTF